MVIKMEQNFPVERIFPPDVRRRLAGSNWLAGLEEIRVRVGWPVEFYYDTGSKYLIHTHGESSGAVAWRPADGEWRTLDSSERKCVYRMAAQDVAEMLGYISSYSLYAYQDEMRQGYITIEGGHRIGLAGAAVMEQGKMTGLSHVSFLNIRIAHEKRDCARHIVPHIRKGESIHNTLFVSEPGAGKTTVLRDTIRLLSEGGKGHPGLKVCVVDERSEIAACHLGIPQNDLGPRTDVLYGCGKPEGMQMLLRAMSPQVLAVDELGSKQDFLAVEQALFSGCRVVGTIHAGDVGELREKPYLHKWLGKKMFGRYIQIVRETDGTRKVKIYDEQMEELGEDVV